MRLFKKFSVLALSILGALWNLSAADQLPKPLFTLRTHPANLQISLDSMVRWMAPYEATRSIGFVGWSEHGMIVAQRDGDLPQLFQLNTPGGKPKQLSHFVTPISRFYSNPNPKKPFILLMRDSGGDEQYRLSLYRRDVNREVPWPTPQGRASEVVWSPDGTRFAYAHTPEKGSGWDIRVGKLPREDRLVLRRPGVWTPLDFSPDKKILLVQKEISAGESELWTLNLRDTSLTRLLPAEKPQAFTEAFFLNSDHGKTSFAFVSDRDGEFQQLYRYRSGDKAPEKLSPTLNGDVEWATLRADRGELLYAINSNGASNVYRLDLGHSSRQVMIQNLPQGLISPGVYAPDGSRVAMGISAISDPGSIHVLSATGKTKLWAQTPSTSADTGLIGIREIRFPTFDSADGVSRKIPAWVYLPPPKFHPPFRVLIQIHGGPEMQARPGYDPFIRFCTKELGLAVIQPNVRGSTGYGKSYECLDDNRKRMDAVQDIGALLDWIQSHPEFDAKKVAVMGRSYGGFMALSSLTHYGDRFCAGISAVGISHFPSFLGNTAGYRQDLRRVEYGDERDSGTNAFLENISPLNQADKIHAPLLLIHGQNDPRVPLDQSEKMFSVLEKGTSENWMFVLGGEGHGVHLKSDEKVYRAVIAQFLIRHLGP